MAIWEFTTMAITGTDDGSVLFVASRCGHTSVVLCESLAAPRLARARRRWHITAPSGARGVGPKGLNFAVLQGRGPGEIAQQWRRVGPGETHQDPLSSCAQFLWGALWKCERRVRTIRTVCTVGTSPYTV